MANCKNIAISFFIVFSLFTLFVSCAKAIDISGCSNLNQNYGVYYLTADITNSDANYCMNITANHVTLDCQGHIIDGKDLYDSYAIYINRSSATVTNVTIKNCVITDWGYGAIYLGNAQNNNIYNSTVNSNIYGIYLTSNSNYNTISNSTVNRNLLGIVLESSSNNIISNSTTNSNDYYGIYLTSNSNYNTIYNNVIQSNSIYGIRIDTSSNNRIYNNLFNNTNNFYFGGTIYLNYWNTTRQTGKRIYSPGTEIGGNYWTNPNGNGYSDTCIDSDTNGFCDNPYTLASNNIDYLPLSDEYAIKISTCSILDQEGATYVLTADITNSDANYCMNITANHVTLDCQGHTIDGTSTYGTYGIITINTNNIIIKNCIVTEWDYGVVIVNGSNSKISNVTANLNNIDGILIVQYSTNNIVNNSTAFGNYYGFHIHGYSVNNTIANSTSISNTHGIYLYSEYGDNPNNNTIYNNIIKDNDYGIIIESASGNMIYNNILNNTNNFYFYGTIYANSWNTTKQSGYNIWNASLGYIGGNTWFKPDGTGFSETSSCHDSDYDGFCDNYYELSSTGPNRDYLPIAKNVGQYPNTAPKWFNNQSYYPYYYQNVTSEINITWVDYENNLDKVLLESNFTGYPVNITIDNSTYGGNIYTYRVFLGPGIYYWKSYANDTYGLWNSTDTWYFTITNKIANCTTINHEGTYYLNNSIINSTNDYCISFGVDNVYLDCSGYTIDGNDTTNTVGILLFNNSNITIKNCTISDWGYGIFLTTYNIFTFKSANVKDINITYNVLISNDRAIELYSYYGEIKNISSSENKIFNNNIGYAVYEFWDYNSNYINITGDSIFDNSIDYDIDDGSNYPGVIAYFKNTNFTETRKIRFYTAGSEEPSKFYYSNGSEIFLITIQKNKNTYETIYRKLINWTQEWVEWNESASFSTSFNYNLTNLLPNTYYYVFENEYPSIEVQSDSNGNINFTLSLTTGIKNIKVKRITLFKKETSEPLIAVTIVERNETIKREPTILMQFILYLERVYKSLREVSLINQFATSIERTYSGIRNIINSLLIDNIVTRTYKGLRDTYQQLALNSEISIFSFKIISSRNPLAINTNIERTLNIFRQLYQPVEFTKEIIYDFKDYVHNKAFWNEVEEKPPSSLNPPGEVEFSQEAYQNISESDNIYYVTESLLYPYQRFNVSINENLNSIEEIRIEWEGHGEEGRTINMYVWNFTSNSWVLVGQKYGTEDFIINKTYVSDFSDIIKDGKIYVMVQDV